MTPKPATLLDAPSASDKSDQRASDHGLPAVVGAECVATPSAPNGAEASGTSDTGLTVMIERLAANPSVDVAKLEKIIDLQERILQHHAKAAFDAAYSVMQSEIPEIDERGAITVKGQLRSRYAKLEDIQKVIKPILKTHGFALRHRTEWPVDRPGIIRVVGILTHRDGHAEESEFEAKADASDYRTDIQSQGSTVSYGRRYTTIDLLNIITRGVDDDGQRAGGPSEPEGYADFFQKLEKAAERGSNILDVAFKEGSHVLKNYLVNTDRNRWAALKAQAAKVK